MKAQYVLLPEQRELTVQLTDEGERPVTFLVCGLVVELWRDGGRKGEIERQRQKGRERQRETHRQIHTKRDPQRQTHTERDTERDRETETDIQRERQRHREKQRQTDTKKQTEIETDRQRQREKISSVARVLLTSMLCISAPSFHPLVKASPPSLCNLYTLLRELIYFTMNFVCISNPPH